MTELPPRERVTKAVDEAMTEEVRTGKVMKVLYLDEKGDAIAEAKSQQIPDDPFEGRQISGLQEPPFNLSQLLFLAETHPVHSAALEQKTADICGKGWEWKPKEEDGAVDEGVKKEVDKWFESLAPDDVDMHEVIYSAWLDLETVGWGLIELTRDLDGNVDRAYHVPGHTVRAHKDGFRLCQVRGNRKVWFRRWGSPLRNGKEVQVDAKTGSMNVVRDRANDLFVIKKPSRRSSWYGIPGYVSAIGWISLALAARDDNLMFFSNRREPRWAILLQNLADDPDIEEDLRRAFTVDLRQPHRNIIVPITGPGKIEFQKLSEMRADGSFEKLSERADKAIMISHRVPSERLANATVGPLGGNATYEASKVYKEGVVAPSQEMLGKRLTRFIEIEYAKKQGKGDTDTLDGDVPVKLVMDDLDIQSDREDLNLCVIRFHGDIVTLRETRTALGLKPLMQPKKNLETGEPIGEELEESPYNDMLFSEIPGATMATTKPGRNAEGTGTLATETDKRRDPSIQLLEQKMAELIVTGRDMNSIVTSLAEHTDNLTELVEQQRRS
jgi:capsid portal protein